MTYSKLGNSLSVLTVLVCFLAPRLAFAQDFFVENNSLYYETDLENVYYKFAERPEFSQSPWCLIDSSAGFAFLYCGRLDYSLIFDTESFLNGNGKVSQEDDNQEAGYKLLEKFESDVINPAKIMNLKSVGDSVTVILRDTTRPDQAQTIITFYRVRDQSD